ncbi:MAG: hypothetical protein WC644_11580 [Ignavibacteria bacterium]
MEYKYDVAFSLEKDDKEIARQINDLIKNKFSTFVYFENKESIASEDGLNLFYNVFNNQSKIVVVLFSEKWGKTDWTTKEEIAIRDRIVKTDWDFIILVKLDKKIIIPDWYPTSHIWVDYTDFGNEGIAKVIENKVKELGGKVKNESFVEKAKRIAYERENLTKIRRTLETENDGIHRANDELRSLFNICRERINYLTENAKSLYFTIKKDEYDYMQIKAHPYILNIHWWTKFSNSLYGAHLDISIKKKVRKGFMFEEHYEDLDFVSYVFNINPSWENGWSIDNYNGLFFTSEKLIDHWFEIILEKLK